MDEDRTDQGASTWAQLPAPFAPPSSRRERDERLKLALQRLEEMAGILPKVDIGDPQRLVTTLVSVLAEYPAEVILAVTDLVRGLPSQLKWFPTVFETRQACEAIVGERRRHSGDQARRDRVRAETLAGRGEMRKPVVGSPEHCRTVAGFAALSEALIAKLSGDDAPNAMRKPRSPAEAEASRAYHAAREEKLKAGWAEKPVTVGPALAAQLAKGREP